MKYHYVWLLWSSAFLGVRLVLYLALPAMRREMLRVSAATSLLGLTEPIFVPANVLGRRLRTLHLEVRRDP